MQSPSRLSRLSRLSQALPPLVGLALLTPGLAHADEDSPLERRLRLHVDTALLGFDQRREGAIGDRPERDPRTHTLTYGFARGRDASELRPLIGFGAGFALRRVVLGANLGVAGQRSRELDDASGDEPFRASLSRIGGLLIPYVNVLLRPDLYRVQPWVGFRFGVIGEAETFRERGRASISGIEISTLARESALTPLVGAGAGVHLMLSPRVSLDLAGTFDYGWTFSRQTERFLAAEDREHTDWEPENRGVRLALLAGLSMWF